MTKRKFTPPTKFPAEYVYGDGDKAVILGRGPNKQFPFVGHDADGWARDWTKKGKYHTDGASEYDLQDIPKRITTWHNVYGGWVDHQLSTRKLADEHYEACKGFRSRPRLCVYRIERDEDGSNPEIFVEEV